MLKRKIYIALEASQHALSKGPIVSADTDSEPHQLIVKLRFRWSHNCGHPMTTQPQLCNCKGKQELQPMNPLCIETDLQNQLAANSNADSCQGRSLSQQTMTRSNQTDMALANGRSSVHVCHSHT
eukprot:1161726-Pelagomonas_calceolata.AAC.2